MVLVAASFSSWPKLGPFSARCRPPLVVLPGVNRLPPLTSPLLSLEVVSVDDSFVPVVGSVVETPPDPDASSPDDAPVSA